MASTPKNHFHMTGVSIAHACLELVAILSQPSQVLRLQAQANTSEQYHVYSQSVSAFPTAEITGKTMCTANLF